MAAVPRNLIGFAVINSMTFALDLAILAATHGILHWPLAASITVGYAIAFAVNFALNRQFNFRSHAAVGPQLAWYVAAVVINYSALILGVGDGLAAAGLDYRVARVLAGIAEAIFMYCALRWVVFRRSDAS
jgi:putative flippase GtrA